jgi:hypothetical protein
MGTASIRFTVTTIQSNPIQSNPIQTANLGPKAFRVTWEGTHMSDVLEVQEEHDDTLQANTTPTMRLRAVAEGIHVPLDGRVVRRRHSELLQAAREKIHVVHTLRARENFLPADEKVVAVAELRVVRARHGVERAYGKRVFVEHEEVRLVLLSHHATQGFLVLRTEVIELTLRESICGGGFAGGCEGEGSGEGSGSGSSSGSGSGSGSGTEVIELTLRVPSFLQHFHGFRKLETQGRAEVTQRLGGELLTYGLSCRE